MRTLFDSPGTGRPTEPHLDITGPVPPVEAVLFDFANTIFQMIDIEDWVQRVAADIGDPLDAEGVGSVVEELTAAYSRPHVRTAQVDRDMSAANHRRAMSAWFAEVGFLKGHEDTAYDRMIADDSWRPYPDTGPVLRELKQRNIPVGVVSDIAWNIRAHVAHFGLSDLIRTYALSFEVGREKPDPQLFLKACADLGADPRRTLMVGDNPARDGGAAAIGIRSFIFPCEHRVSERGLHQVLRLIDE